MENNNSIEKNKTYYISFDCACVTLGYMIAEIIDIDKDTFFIRDNIINCESIELKLYKYGVINLIEGYKINEVPLRNKIYNLKYFLDSIMENIDVENCIVIVEDQPSFNTTSNPIESAIYMYYAYAKAVITIGSSKKNTLSFDESLSINNFYSKYSKAYDANKAHTSKNLEYFCKKHNIELNLSKSLYNHLGDAFMQFIFIVKEHFLKQHNENKSNIENNIINQKIEQKNNIQIIESTLKKKEVTINEVPIKIKGTTNKNKKSNKKDKFKININDLVNNNKLTKK
jgi:hypothetical protein